MDRPNLHEEILKEIPEEIDGFQRRLMVVNDFVIIEYSKSFNAGRYLGMKPKMEDVLFEVYGRTIEECVLEIKDKLHLDNIIKNEFPDFLNVPIYPLLGFEGQPQLVKPIQLGYVLKPHENYYHIVVATTNLDRDINYITNIVAGAVEEIKKGEIVNYSLSNQGLTLQAKNSTFTKMVYLFTRETNVSTTSITETFNSIGCNALLIDDDYINNVQENKRPDFFICHDYRDKEAVATPLYNELTAKKAKVWYDDYSLTVGDSLSEKLEEGIRECRYGILIVSKYLLENKSWGKYEIQSFISKQVSENRTLILPVWHSVTKGDIAKVNHWLADKKALIYSNSNIEVIANNLINKLNS